MAAAKGTFLDHVTKESSDVKRLAQFYQEILGFEQIESPNFPDVETIWLKLPPSFYLHLIQRYPASRLPEGPWRASESAVADPKNLPTGHHMCFTVPNFDFAVQTLKVTVWKLQAL
ncbi:uncharacterized protein LOC127798795 [Diospyros lotus]|uniref:uncharacterized protein LOC127798795 n=1 Tax=Diospyros lotus TaxID=55363 RepID=UPI0022516529|nr:uncharacterized protein LOC127798795 [Diospyros lotus]